MIAPSPQIPLQSMTGFGNAALTDEGRHISCDMRSVNGKNLDVRVRLPHGLEALEQLIKKQIAAHITRGNLQISISIDAHAERSAAKIDADMFSALAKQGLQLAQQCGIAPPSSDGLLAIRGMVSTDEISHIPADKDGFDALNEQVLAVVTQATMQLKTMRQKEGEALRIILSGQIENISTLAHAARDDEANQPDAVMHRLQAQLVKLTDASTDTALDVDRLHAEAALLATKCDICEEIDRLDAHVAAAKDLLSAGGPVGRKLDFLSQEFNRETNTICSKSASASLTSIGLDLKAVIDQFREQVQNLQ